MDYRVLGPVGAQGDDGREAPLGGPRPRAILGMLILHLGRPVPADELIAAVWEETPTDGRRQSLRSYLSRLRAAVTDPIRHVGGGYLLDVAPNAIDAHRFELLADAGRDALARGPRAAAGELRRALELWRGRPYEDVAELETFRLEVDRLGRRRLAALEDRLEADLALGHHRVVAEELAALVREHPFRERLWAMRMLALYRDGRQADALDTFARVRRLLRDELGVDPGDELRELHARLLRQDPDLRAPPTARSSTPWPPYVGGLELRRPIGTGSHGTVHRAFQASLGREVAVKVLAPHLANDRRLVLRFAEVTRGWVLLDHPHLLGLLDAWRGPEAAHLVLPLQEDRLELRLARGPLSTHEALRIVDETAQAVAYLHRHRLAHGAVGVSNVLLDDEGHVRLSDCGTARLFGDPDPRADLVALGALARRLLCPAGHRSDPAVHSVLEAATTGGYERVEDLQRELRRSVGPDVVAEALAIDAPRPIRNPFKGLRPFELADAEDYFGRDGLVATIVSALGRLGFVTLVGPSGSGKSSVVRAGVLPSLRREGLPGSGGWLVADLFPGRYPTEALLAAVRAVSTQDAAVTPSDLLRDPSALLDAVEGALPGTDDVLLLIVDQLEEVFAPTVEPGDAAAFLTALAAAAAAAPRVRVLATLRGDSFEQALSSPIAEALTRGCVPVAAPPPGGLAEAITRPVDRAGLIWEPGLVDEIVADVRAQPGSLPLLQYACTDLVEGREGRVLTRAAYRGSGGVAGILRRRAEEAYGSLVPVAEPVAEAVFIRLVTVRPDGRDVRRRVHRSELESLGDDRASLEEVLDVFGRANILTFDRDPVTRGATVEIAHDALLVHWPRLGGWLRARREDIVHRQRLQESLREWEEAGHDPRFLLPAARREQYEAAASAGRLTVTDDEREFLAASREQAEADTLARRRRQRWIVAVLTALGVLTSVVAVVALDARRSAVAAASLSRVRELATSSLASVDADPELAVLLALEAAELARGGAASGLPVALDALQVAVRADRTVVTDGRIVGEVSWSRDGARLAGAAAQDGDGPRAMVLDVATGEVIMETPPGPAAAAGIIRDLSLSSDGTRLVTTFLGGAPAALWDVDTGELLHRLSTPTSFPRLPSLSGDGRRVAVTNTLLDELGEQRGRSVSVFDLRSAEEIRRLVPVGGVGGAALSPDGQVVAVAAPEAATVWLYDLERSTPPRPLLGFDDQPHAVAWSPSGRRVAALGVQGEVGVWDAIGGERVLSGRSQPVLIEAAFVDEDRLVTSTSRGPLEVWDIRAGLVVDELRGHGRAVYGLDVREGRYVLTASTQSTKVFDLDAAAGAVDAWVTGTSDTVSLALVPDPLRVAVAHVDGVTVLLDGESGERLRAWTDLFTTSPAASAFALVRSAVAVSSDGRQLAMTSLAPRDPSRPVTSPVYRTEVLDLADLDAPPVRHVGAPLGYDVDGPDLFLDDRGWMRVVGPEQQERSRTDLRGEVVVSAQGLPDRALALVVVGRDGAASLLVVDTTTGDRIRGLPLPRPPQSQVGALAIDARATELAVGVAGEVLLFDLPQLTGRPGATPTHRLAAGADVTSLAYSPDDGLLVVGTTSGVEVWHRRGPQRSFTIPSAHPVWDVAVTPDGRRAVVTGPGGSVHTHLLEVDDLLRGARSSLSRSLTDHECVRYLGSACPPSDG